MFGYNKVNSSPKEEPTSGDHEDPNIGKANVNSSWGRMVELCELAGFYKSSDAEVEEAKGNTMRKYSAGKMAEKSGKISFYKTSTFEVCSVWKDLKEESTGSCKGGNEEIEDSESEVGTNEKDHVQETQKNLYYSSEERYFPRLVDIPVQVTRYDQGWIGPFQKI